MMSRREGRSRAKVKDCLAELLKWFETGSMLYPAEDSFKLKLSSERERNTYMRTGL